MFYPLTLYFGKNEIEIFYREAKGYTERVFTFPVMWGENNHEKFAKKIKDYWNMLAWSPPQRHYFNINIDLIPMSYFSSWYEFNTEKNSIIDRFVKLHIFRYKKNIYRKSDISIADYRIKFVNHHVDNKFDIWKIINNEILSCKINLRKLILDFIYESDLTSTFSDENYISLKPILHENKLFDAITKKCRYLDNLYKLKDTHIKSSDKLPKVFLDAEKAWLNICINPQYRELFDSEDEIFHSNEDEITKIAFDALIGNCNEKD
ncbi:MAG: hypothetical protein H7844_08670 [Nitrospirae bacterium YQR-1]